MKHNQVFPLVHND